MTGTIHKATMPPKKHCCMYQPDENDCVALVELLCTYRECPFFKTREQAREARRKSVKARKARGVYVPDKRMREDFE